MPGTTPIAGDTLQARVVCYTPTQIALNILCYNVVSITGTGANLFEIATNMEAVWSTSYKAMMPSTAGWRGVGLKNLYPPATLEVPIITNAGPGTGGSNLLPTQTTGIIRFLSGFAGRANRGRAYMPFPSTSYISADGSPTTGWTALMVGQAILFGPTIVVVGGGGTSTLRHRIRHRSVGLSSLDVITYGTPKVWAVQHRRGMYGQPNILPF